MGIEMYEMRAEEEGAITSFGSVAGSAGGSRARLHAKVLVVGSMNLDLRSRLHNSEVAMVICKHALAAEATWTIEPALANDAWRVELVDGQRVWRAPPSARLEDSKTEPDASLGLKLMLRLIGPFAPDEML